MHSFLTGLIRAIESVTTGFGWVAAATTVPLALFMVYEVISRYLFNAPTFWAYELAYMLMGGGLMLGIAFTMKARAHVRVDFAYAAMSQRNKAIVDFLGYLVLLPMVLWLCVGLWDYFLRAYSSGEVSGESAWNPVVWPFRATFVLGFVLFALQILAEMVKSGVILLTGNPLQIDDGTRGRL